MSTQVDMRCPVNPSRLMGRVKDPDDDAARIVDGNLIEIACEWCKDSRRRRGEKVKVVLHRYNVLGQHVEDEVIEQ